MGERVVSRCRAVLKGGVSVVRLWVSLNRQFGWPSLGHEHAGNTLNYVMEATSVLLLLTLFHVMIY